MTDSPGPEAQSCPRCGKPVGLCVCAALVRIDNRVELLVLRHPQEQDRELGTAGILCRQLARATLVTGLSWPNLARALGRPAETRRWGALYLGTRTQAPAPDAPPLLAVDAEGAELPDQEGVLDSLEGLILLDGNWAQAKALWWRNAWLLKTRRLVLNPRAPSLYGDLRREPRRESVSTLEAGALALSILEGRPEIVAPMLEPLRMLLRKYRDSFARPKTPDRRRRRRR
ncbi:MAG: DTW domain-containing protein [Alphaproteobacteria bacterium]|nr:DTW domain-containing protein [Alphaproteobacteria bacterium]MCW5743487.1 DTW domain-containing protein [Alphaproteobacteria bacterium]